MVTAALSPSIKKTAGINRGGGGVVVVGGGRKEEEEDGRSLEIDDADKKTAGTVTVSRPLSPPQTPPPQQQQQRASHLNSDQQAASSSSSSSSQCQPLSSDAHVPDQPQLQEVIRSPYVIYPDQYSKFDVKRVSFGKEPQVSNEGSGQILFISYMYENVLKPLLIQTPNGMHAPTGAVVWPDGKASMLLSVGRDWEINPLMVTFKTIIDSIQKRCEEVVADKQWNSPGTNEISAIHEGFTPIAFIGEGQKGELYPPSIKGSLIMAGNNKTELHAYSGAPPYRPMVLGDVVPGSSVTAIVQLAWMFRKKSKKSWQFSVRVNVFQAVVEVPKSGGRNGGGCIVCF